MVLSGTVIMPPKKCEQPIISNSKTIKVNKIAAGIIDTICKSSLGGSLTITKDKSNEFLAAKSSNGVP